MASQQTKDASAAQDDGLLHDRFIDEAQQAEEESGAVRNLFDLRVIIGDYVKKPKVRVAINYFFYALTLIIFAVGTVVVFTFDPTKWGPIA